MGGFIIPFSLYVLPQTKAFVQNIVHDSQRTLFLLSIMLQVLPPKSSHPFTSPLLLENKRAKDPPLSVPRCFRKYIECFKLPHPGNLLYYLHLYPFPYPRPSCLIQSRKYRPCILAVQFPPSFWQSALQCCL